MSKTLEEYRTITKLLKLDILKVKVENEQLAQKLAITDNNHQPEQTPINLSDSVIGNPDPYAVAYVDLQHFLAETKRLGMTPEMIYRLADVSKSKQISVDKFKKTLASLKTKLDKTRLERLALRVDQTKRGVIDYLYYLNVLNAFQANTEAFPPGSLQTYFDRCFNKLAQEARNQNSDLKQLDTEMQLNFQRFKTAVEKSVKNMNELELVCVFLHYDKTKQLLVSPDLLYKHIKEEMRKLKPVPSDRQNNNQRPKDKTDDNKQKPEKVEKVQGFKDVSSQAIIKTHGVDIHMLIELLLKRNLGSIFGISQTVPLNKAFTLLQVKDALDQSSTSKRVSREQLMVLYKDIDEMKKGTINIFDLGNFFIRTKKPDEDYDTLFELLAYSIAAARLNPEMFLEKEGLQLSDKLDMQSFKKLWKGFRIHDSHMIRLFERVRKSDSNLTNETVAQVLREFHEFKDHTTPAASVLESKPSAIVARELKDFEDIIKKVSVSSSSQLPKKSLGQDEKKWNTIFTDPAAALKACYSFMREVVRQRMESKKSSSQAESMFWLDPEFGPTPQDPSGWSNINRDVSSPLSFLPKQKDVRWVTPSEYLQTLGRKTGKYYDKPFFMYDEAKKNDVIQSDGLGNCWFIAALSLLTSQRHLLLGPKTPSGNTSRLLEGIHPPLFQAFGKFGIYVFKFFKQKIPVYVIVDNCIPINLNTWHPLFGRSANPSSLWVGLVEKAYAKLHQSYAAIQSGEIIEALVDLTGFFAVKQFITDSEFETNELKDQFWKRLLRFKSDELLGCSIAPGKNSRTRKDGLVEGHAYALLQLIELSTTESNNYHQSHRLLCLRNPQGDSEWTGAWSELEERQLGSQSKLQKNRRLLDQYFQARNQELRRQREDPIETYTIKEGDGVFLMRYSDWRTHFDNLYRSFKMRPSCKRFVLKDGWSAGMPAGFPKTEQSKKNFYRNNYAYRIEIRSENCEVFIELRQQDGRLMGNIGYPFAQVNVPLSVFIIKPKNDKKLQAYNKQELVCMHPVERKRSVSISKTLKKGNYIIVPWQYFFIQAYPITFPVFSTNDCLQSKYYGKFELEVFVEGDAKLDSSFKERPVEEEVRIAGGVQDFYKKLRDNTKQYKLTM